MLRAAGAICLVTACLGCTSRVEPEDEVAGAFAKALCGLDGGCECSQSISACTASVEEQVRQWEREATAAGLTLDRDCMERFLGAVGGLGACGPSVDALLECPVYSGGRAEGEACERYGFYPLMTECGEGLDCDRGVCRNPDDRQPLGAGEVCTDVVGVLALGFDGRCRDDLRCDIEDSLTCVAAVLAGDSCEAGGICQVGHFCKTDDPATPPTPASAGVCTPSDTPPGAPCEHLWECATICDPQRGVCQERQPGLCTVLDDMMYFINEGSSSSE